MLTLFHAPQSRSSRIVWLIEELGADCAVEYVDIAHRMGRKVGEPDPRNPHPDGKVPALLDHGALVTECGAVALHLTGLFPDAGLGAPAGSPQRAEILTWLFWVAGELEPSIWAKMSRAADADPGARLRYDQAMERLIVPLWSHPWLMGDRFTVADVMAGSALVWARPFLPDNPVLNAYVERLTERPAYMRAQARDAAPVAPELAAA